MFDFINRLKFSRGFELAIIIFATIITPYWFCLHFKPNLVSTETNTVKLIFTCLGIGIPILLLNALVTFLGFSKGYKKVARTLADEERKDFTFSLMYDASLSNIINLYIPCIATYFTPIDFRMAVATVIIITCGSIGANISRSFFDSRKEADEAKANLAVKIINEEKSKAQTP